MSLSSSAHKLHRIRLYLICGSVLAPTLNMPDILSSSCLWAADCGRCGCYQFSSWTFNIRVFLQFFTGSRSLWRHPRNHPQSTPKTNKASERSETYLLSKHCFHIKRPEHKNSNHHERNVTTPKSKGKLRENTILTQSCGNCSKHHIYIALRWPSLSASPSAVAQRIIKISPLWPISKQAADEWLDF